MESAGPWLKTFTTELNADSVECDMGKIAVGTYQLEENGSKHGMIYLFNQSLDFLEYSVKTDAILDMKWIDQESLAFATNSKGICILRKNQVLSSPNPTQSVHLALHQSSQRIFSSCSDGQIAIYSCADLSLKNSLKAHDLEVWSVDSKDSLLLTGSDDCLFKGWDLASGDNIFVNKRHGAGVCSIALHPTINHIVSTGSYDKGLRVWDMRAFRAPLVETFVNSGVWRLKWHPSDSNLLLAACMHDGFYVFNMDQERFQATDHRPSANLAYGCAWMNRKIFGCTFYNKQVQEWMI